MVPEQVEVHNSRVLAWARRTIEEAASPRLVQQAVIGAVRRNAIWQGDECLNLLAPEAPMSPVVRRLLSAEVGQRAAEKAGPDSTVMPATISEDNF